MFTGLFTSFTGRISRIQFVIGIGTLLLSTFIVALVAISLITSSGGQLSPETVINLDALLFVVTVLPYTALCWKRLHDMNTHGAWALISLLPYVNILFVIILALTRGTSGFNDYGEEPLGIEYKKIRNNKNTDASTENERTWE
jgi:uncharacterized membrane protein YhaH (DUF805 family)